MSAQNLDRLCAQFGYEMCQKAGEKFKGKDGKPDKAKTENLIAKSLGVLQEDGVYAFFLYLASRGSEKDGADELGKQAADLLSDDKVKLLAGDIHKTPQAVLEAIRRKDGLADDLDNLLLAKRLLEQALIYARYHAKALPEKQEKQP